MPGTRTSFKDMDCGFAQALEQIGDQWCLLIVRNLFMGMTRFDDFAAHLSISTKVLSDRLERLSANDIVTWRADPKDGRGKIYELTEKGADLALVYSVMTTWGETWAPKKGGPRTEFYETTTGRAIGGFAAVDKQGRALPRNHVGARTGPGGSEVRERLEKLVEQRNA